MDSRNDHIIKQLVLFLQINEIKLKDILKKFVKLFFFGFCFICSNIKNIFKIIIIVKEKNIITF